MSFAASKASPGPCRIVINTVCSQSVFTNSPKVTFFPLRIQDSSLGMQSPLIARCRWHVSGDVPSDWERYEVAVFAG